MNIPKSDLPRIVIVGGGFAGLQLARNIDTSLYQVVLIDKNNFHTFQPLLYQVATTWLEPDSIAYPYRKTLQNKKNTFFRLAEVRHIDTEEQLIDTDLGSLRYNYLVIATGATNNFFNNKSIEENSLPMKSLTDSLDLRSKILQNFERALQSNNLEEQTSLMNIVIVGAGPTGVELAGALAELRNKILPKDYPDLDFRRMQINLIEAAPRVLQAMSEESSTTAHRYLRELGVQIFTNTFVDSYDGKLVKTKDGNDFNSSTLIWAAGVAGQFPAGFDAKQIGRGNRLVTDGFLKLNEHENIFVLGDAGLIQSEKTPNGLPMLGSVAMQQGIYLGKTLNQMARGKQVAEFSYNDKGTMATIGKNKAVVELQKFKFTGFPAWVVWMGLHLMLLVGFRNRIVVFINWAWQYIFTNNSLRLIVRKKNH